MKHLTSFDPGFEFYTKKLPLEPDSEVLVLTVLVLTILVLTVLVRTILILIVLMGITRKPRKR